MKFIYITKNDVYNLSTYIYKTVIKMEIYRMIEYDNGDILLKKVIIDEGGYIVTNEKNGDRMLKKIKKESYT
jgi:hypothetical protein